MDKERERDECMVVEMWVRTPDGGIEHMQGIIEDFDDIDEVEDEFVGPSISTTRLMLE